MVAYLLMRRMVQVFDVACAISKDKAALEEFRPLTRWHQMTWEQRKAFYSAHLCHELNVFTYMRDPEFFAEVARPMVASKLKKDTVDRILLGEDLDGVLAPALLQRLNAFEKASRRDGALGPMVFPLAPPCLSARRSVILGVWSAGPADVRHPVAFPG
jgi:hypothetical protein